MNLTKNSVSELYKGVCNKEKWDKYLLQHLNKKTSTPTELESLIHWAKTTYIEIIEDTNMRKSIAVNY